MATPMNASPLLYPREATREPTKPSKSPVKSRSSLRHRVKSPTETVKESELSLQKLLEDFEEGKLNAFANSDVLQQLNGIREMQERLTIRHFEIDQMRIKQDSSAEGYKDDSSLKELTKTLENLGTMIQSLHDGSMAQEEPDVSQSPAPAGSSPPQQQ